MGVQSMDQPKHIALLVKVAARASIAIEQGRLVIIPSSGSPIPDDWLQENQDDLFRAISEVTGIALYSYIGYSTFPSNSKTGDGVHLQFQQFFPREGLTAFAIYNANIRYSRGDNAGKVKDNNQFGASKGSKFYSFWLRTGLRMPRFPSVFHEVMFDLKALLFTLKAESVDEDIKADKDSVNPASIAYKQIAESLRIHQEGIKYSSRTHQEAVKNSSRSPSRRNPVSPYASRATDEFHHGEIHHGNKVQGNKVDGNTVGSSVSLSINRLDMDRNIIDPQNQTADDWLRDYENALNATDIQGLAEPFK